VLEHPPYSPALAPCDFYLFPKIKSVLKGTHLVSVENVKAKTAEILNSLTEHELWNCFEHWHHRMQLCVNFGTILKAIVVDFLNLLNRKSYRHSLGGYFCVGPRMYYATDYLHGYNGRYFKAQVCVSFQFLNHPTDFHAIWYKHYSLGWHFPISCNR
jgi:hypothetical protein